jgi:hypothetical protein
MTELIAGLALHVVAGLALCVLVWALGLGLLLLARVDAAPPAAVLAYPVGLLAATAAAFALLVEEWLALPLAAALALPALALVRAGPLVRELARGCAAPAAWALPGVVALPVALGLLLHGPTEELDSHAFGDMVFYAAKLVSAEQSVLPFRDLLVEGEPSAFVEAGSSFLGAAIAWIPGIDPFLVQTTLLPAFALGSIPIGLGLLGRTERSTAAARLLPVAGLVAVTMVAYPTWLTESPPVALALPLTFAVYVIAVERLPLGLLAAAAAVLAVDYALTKGFGALLVGVAVLAALARDHRDAIDRRAAIALAAGGLVLFAGTLVFLLATSGWLTERFSFKFLPADAVRGLADQLDTRDTQKAGLGVELLGLLALLAALVRARAATLAAVLVVALVAHAVVGGHGFDVLVGSAILLVALHAWRHPAALAAERTLLLAAGSLLALSAWFRDVSSLRAGLVFLALMGIAVVGAFAGRRVVWAWPGAAAAVLCAVAGRSLVGAVLLLATVAAGALVPRAAWAVAGAALAAAVVLAVSSELALTTQPPTLTSEDHAVWEAAEDAVPADGLVFTSLTGPAISGEQGWNYYPGVSGRRVYLAGWSNSILLVDEEERARRLRLNDEVLRGEREPDDLPLDGRYSSFFAVLRADERPPAGAERIDANERFALYRLRG